MAVRMYGDLMAESAWGVDQAWLAIASLLMTCEVWEHGAWIQFFEAPVLMERNNYKLGRNAAPNRTLRDSEAVKRHLATALGVADDQVCSRIGLYLRDPAVSALQPNNLRGHAFRSIVAETLARFGDPDLDICEELKARDLFPGWDFGNRSKEARVDITAVRDGRVVAMITTRWTYRHDRVDMIDEARAYLPAARNANRKAQFYGVTAEVGVARLKKVIGETASVHPNAAITRLVHLNPALPGPVMGNNGTLAHLMSLSDLVQSTWTWR